MGAPRRPRRHRVRHDPRNGPSTPPDPVVTQAALCASGRSAFPAPALAYRWADSTVPSPRPPHRGAVWTSPARRDHSHPAVLGHRWPDRPGRQPAADGQACGGAARPPGQRQFDISGQPTPLMADQRCPQPRHCRDRASTSPRFGCSRLPGSDFVAASTSSKGALSPSALAESMITVITGAWATVAD